MKVLLFTHKSDIDGMGSAVLSRLAFEDVCYVLCETFNLEDEIKKYLKEGRIYDYDKIYVTDLMLQEPLLSEIANDEKLKDKFFVFDHHKSALEDVIKDYLFVTLRISDENGLCSGTSLFYDYLIKEGLIDKNNAVIKHFSELTRRYDTWEWKTKYNDEMAHQLTLLFDAVGCEGYIKLMYQKLKDNDNERFLFSEFELLLIDNKIEQVKEKLENYSNKTYYKDVYGLKAGIIFIDYEYRNDLAQYLREKDYEIDFVMLIALDYGTISYRSIKDNVNVRIIAEKMGGKGHDKAASSPITKEQKDEIVRLLIEK